MAAAAAAPARCPSCAGADLAPVYDLRAVVGPEAIPGLVWRCRGCGMWFKTLSDPAGLPTAYAGEHGSDAVAATYLLGDAARALFRDALAPLARRDGPAPRLLDVGAAQGALLEEAARLGFEAEGLDHCAANVDDARARGLAVRLGAAEALADEAAFDVVTMMDFIEHVTAPAAVLARAHRALRPGGTLVVYTPNHRAMVVVLARLLYRLGARHPATEIFGRNHVCFFDDRTLPRLLARSGFTVDAVVRSPYDPSRPGQEISPIQLAAVGAAEWLGRPLGRVFRLLAYARRPD